MGGAVTRLGFKECDNLTKERSLFGGHKRYPLADFRAQRTILQSRT